MAEGSGDRGMASERMIENDKRNERILAKKSP